MSMKYNANGCANVLTAYMLAFVEDASQALGRPERATSKQWSALARLQNGAVGWSRDQFIDAIAAAAGKAPKDVYQGLLDQARLKAGQRKRIVNYPVWAGQRKPSQIGKVVPNLQQLQTAKSPKLGETFTVKDLKSNKLLDLKAS